MRPSVLLACFTMISACGGGGGSQAEAGIGPATAAPRGGPFGPVEDGLATFYDATGAGACGFDPTPSDLDVVALDTRQYQKGAWCGACVRVDGPKGSVTVRVVDECPTCDSAKHLDLSRSAFAKIAEPAKGRVDVQWQFVSCAVSGPIAFKFKEGSNEWWTAVQVRNHAYPLKSVEAKVGSEWKALERVEYGYFVAADGLGPGPYDFRVTSLDGQALEETGIAFAEGAVVSGRKQFE